MKFTAISILALAALASGSPTSRTYPQCNPWNPAARDDLIKSCVDELNAHGEDILTIEGVPSHPYFTTAYENVCARECDDPSAVTKCAQSVVSIQLYTFGIFNTTKRDVACGVKTILDACITPAVARGSWCPGLAWLVVRGTLVLMFRAVLTECELAGNGSLWLASEIWVEKGKMGFQEIE